jgi:cobalt-zinc-cadmium efflux system outer membrane protein
VGALACAAALLGCSVPREAGFPDVAKAVEARTGHRIFWNQGGAADAEVDRVVRAMLQHELRPAEAVQIALLGNRSLQATYEELMIAQADVVQAGLLRNPVFAASFRFSPQQLYVPNIDLDVEQDFLSVLMLPARKRVAEATFESVKLRVGYQVVELAYEVRGAYFSLQGALQIAAMRRAILEAAEASLDLATRQHEAGNTSDADLASEQALHEQVLIDLARSRAEILAAREKLTRLMGLWGEGAGFTIGERLPDLPTDDPPLAHVESLAITQRLDVASARQEMQARSYALAMARDFRWLGAVSAGGHFERELDQHFIGPMVQLELPIFDQKQAAIARLEAELQQSKSRLHALSVEARSEVREARGRVVLARELAEHYRTVVIPLRERLVALMQQQYDAMLIGVYQVLMAKQNEVNAYREYIEAVRDYWIARSDLDRAAGGRLVGQSSAPLGTPSPPPPVTPPPSITPPPPATPPTGAHQHQEHSP